MKKKIKIKTFFYTIRNQERREKELNSFLSQNGIVIDQILQSATTASVFRKKPQYLDGGVVITIVYHRVK